MTTSKSRSDRKKPRIAGRPPKVSTWTAFRAREEQPSKPVDMERVMKVIARYQSLPVLDPRPIEDIIDELNR